MIIKISSLVDGVYSYNFDEPVEEIGLVEPFNGNIIVDLELSKANSQIVMNAKLKVGARFECDRCTAEFNTDLSAEYKMVYLADESPEESDSVNIAYLSHDADKIDISGEVRDYAMLAIPMKKLCSDNCKGLCPKCGKDLNKGSCECSKNEIDDRWQPLMELKNKFNIN